MFKFFINFLKFLKASAGNNNQQNALNDFLKAHASQQQLPQGMYSGLNQMQAMQLQQQIEIAKLLPYFNQIQANNNNNRMPAQIPPQFLPQLTPEQLMLIQQQQHEQQMLERLSIQQIQQILGDSYKKIK